MVVSHTCNRWWDNVHIKMMGGVSVFFKMIMVRKRMMMTCDLSAAEVSDIIARQLCCVCDAVWQLLLFYSLEQIK